MQAREMPQQVIAFQKRAIDSWDEAMALVENQATASVHWMLDTAVWMPKEGRRVMEEWITLYKEERGRLKTHLDQQLTAAEKIFTPTKKPTSTSTSTSTSTKPKSSPIKKKKETSNESV
jgi:hypothetical protein